MMEMTSNIPLKPLFSRLYRFCNLSVKIIRKAMELTKTEEDPHGLCPILPKI